MFPSSGRRRALPQLEMRTSVVVVFCLPVLILFFLSTTTTTSNSCLFVHGLATRVPLSQSRANSNRPNSNSPNNNKARPTVRISTTDNNQKKKKKQKEEWAVDRRKSPALWRLLYQDDDDQDHIDADSNDNNHQATVPSRPFQKKPEIMAPAGGWEQLKAAVANGADSIYLGLSAFSARARAVNFDATHELPSAVQYCHKYNVHVYVALNTLVFDHELEEVAQLVQQCHHAQVDALIVQDLGLCKLIQNVLHEMEEQHVDSHSNNDFWQMQIHSSTQQSITSADGVRFCHNQHGATRVVLGRELSVAEIAHVTQRILPHNNGINHHNGINNNVPTTRDAPEIETFVHGALCVSYSGQCFSSEAWGGRSANRGQCAQACRLPYGLVVDGQLQDNNKNNHDSRMMQNNLKYVLSPQDLCGLDQVPALIRAGVSCLKIEGRLKDASYVAATTRAYRNAVDQAWEEIMLQQEKDNDKQHDNQEKRQQRQSTTTTTTKTLSSPDEHVSRLELTQLFSRGQDEEHSGLTAGFLAGTQHQTVVRGRSPRHRGVHAGRVTVGTSPGQGIVLEVDDGKNGDLEDAPPPLKRGDGIVIDRGLAQEEELGGPIFDIQPLGRDKKSGKERILIQLGREVLQKWKQYDKTHQGKGLAPVGAHVWKTHDAVIDKKFRRLTQLAPPSQTLSISVRGALGQPLQIVLDYGAVRVVGETDVVLEAAQTKGLALASIRKAIGTLGNTEFAVDPGTIDFSQLVEPDSLFCPASQIKQARRRAVEQLVELTSEKEQAMEDQDRSSPLAIEGGPQKYINDKMNSDANANQDQYAIDDKVHLSVLCRNLEQVDAICGMLEQSESDDDQTASVSEIIVDFLEVDGMRDAVNRIKQCSDGSTNQKIKAVVASPRILKPEEEGIWKSLLSMEPDGLLIRSTGLLHRMQSMGGEGACVELEATATEPDGTLKTSTQQVCIPELIGDFSLNAANAITAFELLSFGLQRITASYDLNANSIASMAEMLGPNYAHQLEVVVHCKMPIFHTEHCVFARFLTKGNSYMDCGHACTRHSVHLRDELSGHDNLVLADMGCRNTVFTAQAQSGVHSLGQWQRAGVRNLRIELVDEGRYDAKKIVQTYLDAANGECKAAVAWEILGDCKDSNGRVAGVTLGSFKNNKERRAGELNS